VFDLTEEQFLRPGYLFDKNGLLGKSRQAAPQLRAGPSPLDLGDGNNIIELTATFLVPLTAPAGTLVCTRLDRQDPPPPEIA